MSDQPQAPLQKTPLHALHVALGARMVPFAGYEMPVQYPTGIVAEHLHTRRQAGLFEGERMAANAAQLGQWFADGTITPPVGRLFPFEAFREALAFARTGGGLGKAVLTVGR